MLNPKINQFLHQRGFELSRNVQHDWQVYASKPIRVYGKEVILQVVLPEGKLGMPKRCKLTSSCLPNTKAIRINGTYKWLVLFDQAVEAITALSMIYSPMPDPKSIRMNGRELLEEAGK
jgi:hypothetical protein